MEPLTPRTLAMVLAGPVLAFTVLLSLLAIGLLREYGMQAFDSLLIAGFLLPIVVVVLSVMVLARFRRSMAVVASSLGAVHFLCFALFALLLSEPGNLSLLFLGILFLGTAAMYALLIRISLYEVRG